MIRRCWEMNKDIALKGRERTTLVTYWTNKRQKAVYYSWKIRIFPNEFVGLVRFPGRVL